MCPILTEEGETFVLGTTRLPAASVQQLVALWAAVSHGLQLKDPAGLSREYETPVSRRVRL